MPNSARASTMPRALNAGDFADAADQFDKWDRSGAKCGGRLLRRQAEQALFDEVDASTPKSA
ncbi:MAG: glycoside hydrolase family protein [Terracidiphilus sp.]